MRPDSTPPTANGVESRPVHRWKPWTRCPRPAIHAPGSSPSRAGAGGWCTTAISRGRTATGGRRGLGAGFPQGRPLVPRVGLRRSPGRPNWTASVREVSLAELRCPIGAAWRWAPDRAPLHSPGRGWPLPLRGPCCRNVVPGSVRSALLRRSRRWHDRSRGPMRDNGVPHHPSHSIPNPKRQAVALGFWGCKRHAARPRRSASVGSPNHEVRIGQRRSPSGPGSLHTASGRRRSWPSDQTGRLTKFILYVRTQRGHSHRAHAVQPRLHSRG